MKSSRWLLWAASAAAIHFAPAALAAVGTTLKIAVDPTTVLLNVDATVTATLKPDSGTISCGKGQIQYRAVRNADNNASTGLTGAPGYELDLSGGWQQLANNLPVASNVFSATFNTLPITLQAPYSWMVGDKVQFRAGYTSSGNNCDYEVKAIGDSPTVDLLIGGSVAAACPNDQTTGVHVTITDAGGNGTPAPGYSGEWTFQVNVQACEDVTNVSAQGGANGWAGFIKAVPDDENADVAISTKKSNTVLNWTIGDLDEGEVATLAVTVAGAIKDKISECGKVKLLNGAWSALFSNDGGTTVQKSAYTDYVSTVTVTCP